MLRAELSWPAYGFGLDGQQISSVAINADGHLYSLDRGGRSWEDRNASTRIASPVLRRWSLGGELLAEQGAGIFVMPHSVTPCADGGVLVTDVGLHQIIKLDANGTPEWTLGQERKPSGADDCFSLPTDVAVAKDGSFYVSDGYGNARVLKFSSDNVLEKTWGSKGLGEGEFHLPHSVDLSTDGLVYVADRENSRIQVFDEEGTFQSQFQSEEIGKPFAVCRQGNILYVADCGFPTDHRAAIVTIDLSTNATHRFGKFGQNAGDLLGPHGIAVDADGAVYVADAVLGLLKFTPEGNLNV